MPGKTFTLTTEQIKDIYSAGMRRGESDQCAHDWGALANGDRFFECIEAIHDIVNEGFKWGDVGYTDFSDVEAWFKKE